ncbi:polycystic kidney disease protein 1-like 3 [Panicum miliaceum]|uniref:Polycystic kidney disease protein 1-like 3 n=1 Tax=Panicum miliaceum TaxID=4540 RepID=A0A3L6Q7D7_PANMI|nr:polycystic kidney disease protein 1-like 3 [Panicum miliaceum]
MRAATQAALAPARGSCCSPPALRKRAAALRRSSPGSAPCLQLCAPSPRGRAKGLTLMQRRAGMADGEARRRMLDAVKEMDVELALLLEMPRREKERGAAANQLLLSDDTAAGVGCCNFELAHKLNEPARAAKRVEPSLTSSSLRY